MTKIAQIQFSQESGARSALRLQHLFLENQVESTIISLYSSYADSAKNRQMGSKAKLISRVDERLKNALIKYNKKEYGLYSYPLMGTDISGRKEIKDADIIYFHWVLGGFLNLSGIRKILALGKPVVYFLHDMWAFTGGCHYSFDCSKYLSKCNNCQMFSGSHGPDYVTRLFKKKQKLFSSYSNLYFVAPSKWIYECANKSELLKERKIFLIPNTFDTTVFKPIDKKVAKFILNIDGNRKVVAFGAISIDSPYKGWTYLVEALKILKVDQNFFDVLILVFGSGYDPRIAENVPFEIKFVGYLRDEYSAALVYNAADIFIAPSLADVGPATVQESLACGTPVVGFEIGGIPDMIAHKKNGYIAKYRDAVDLSEGVKYCLSIGLSGFMMPEFNPTVIMQKHIDLFNFVKEDFKK